MSPFGGNATASLPPPMGAARVSKNSEARSSRGRDPEARAAIAAYGPYNEDILEQALPVYASWLAASFMVAVARRPDAAPALERQLRFLRRFRG
jgi:hypothetical protein